MTRRVEERDGKKVIVEEKVSNFVDGVYWKIRIVQTSQDGPQFLRLEIARYLSSIDGPGCTEKRIYSLDCDAPYTPSQLIEFAEVCNRKIQDYQAKPIEEFDKLFYGQKPE